MKPLAVLLALIVMLSGISAHSSADNLSEGATRVDCDPPAPLVFVRGNTMWLLRPGTSVPVQIHSTDWISPSSPVFLDCTGDRILFSAHKRERYGASRGEINIDVSDVYIWDERNTKRSESLTGGHSIARAPDRSANKKEIIFISNRHAKLRALMPGSNSSEIYNLADPWKIPSRLTSDGGYKYNPRWSPDGERIAYLWLKDAGDAGIYLLDTRNPGEKPCLIAEAGDYPTWRPDGKAIVYVMKGRLFEAAVPEFGCPIPEPRAVLPDSFEGFVSFPKWTSHGIIFQFSKGRRQGIALYDPETRGTKILVSGAGEFGAADLAPLE